MYENENLKDLNVEILSIAMDAQGPELPRPYVESAGAEFPTVVDDSNILGPLYGFRAIPNGYLIDEDGVIRYRSLGAFDVRREETRQAVEQFIASDSSVEFSSNKESGVGYSESGEVDDLFKRGLAALNDGDRDSAISLWRQAMELDPDNYIVRKQIWAVENPDKFYDGSVDYGWQREQIAQGR